MDRTSVLATKTVNSNQVPIFVLRCIEYFKTHPYALKVEGLFGVKTDKVELAAARQALYKTNQLSLQDKTEKDAHIVANLLLGYFEDLKQFEPLFTYALYEHFIKAISIANINSRKIAFRQALDSLPLSNRETVKVLMGLLVSIIKANEDPKATERRLTKAFALFLLHPEFPKSIDPLSTDASIISAAIKFLQEEYDTLFEKNWETLTSIPAVRRATGIANKFKKHRSLTGINLF
jgi:hypothetical protein